MPVMDVEKKRITHEHRLRMKICRRCGARNAPTARKCRKCRGSNLRWKRRELRKGGM